MRNPVDRWHNNYRAFRWASSSLGLHLGKDYGCEIGDKVYAIADGEVVFTGEVNGYLTFNSASFNKQNQTTSKAGGMVMIKHIINDKVIIAQYGHLMRYADPVGKVGMKVKEGQVIGTILPFKSDGDLLPHLHFGLWRGEPLPIAKDGYGYAKDFNARKWFNPYDFLPQGYPINDGIYREKNLVIN